MKCFYHPEQDAVGMCPQCGRAACSNCLKEAGTGILCKGCIGQQLRTIEAEKKASLEDRQATIDGAWRRLRISQIVFFVFFGFGMVWALMMAFHSIFSRDPQAPGFFEAILGGALGSAIVGYAAWSFYWGVPAVWRGLRKLFSKVGCFLILNPITWLILGIVFFMTMGFIGEFYCLFGGGWFQYRKTVKIAEDPAQTRRAGKVLIAGLAVIVVIVLLSLLSALSSIRPKSTVTQNGPGAKALRTNATVTPGAIPPARTAVAIPSQETVQTPQVQSPVIPDQIGQFLETWRSSFLAGDFDSHMKCYAPMVEYYNGRHNLPQDEVRREREHTLALYGKFRQFNVSNIELTSSAPRRVEMKLRVHWELANSTGDNAERLTLIQADGRWIIAGEDNVVNSIKNQPQPISAKPEIAHPCKDSRSHQPCSESAPSTGSTSTVAKDNSPFVSVVPPTGDPVKTVLDTFDAYIAGNTSGVTSLMSDEGARNSKTLCPGDAATCLRKNYSPFGNLKSRSAEELSHDSATAKVRLMSNWQKISTQTAGTPQCQIYDLSLTAVGWRIDSFSWPVPKSCL